MVLPLWEAILGVGVTAVLATAAVWTEALTLVAGIVATVFGSVIVVVAGFPYLSLLVLFVVASVLATRFRFEEKRRRNVQEGTHGERGVGNVLSHVIIPTGLALLVLVVPSGAPTTAVPFLYASALAFGAADTFASEFGVLAGTARSLLTGRPVLPGTNGAVSAFGQFWALVAAFTTAVVGTGLFAATSTPFPGVGLMVAGVTAVGFVGCQIDSVVGETLENRGLLSKGGTNFFAMLLSVLLAAGLLLATHGGLWS